MNIEYIKQNTTKHEIGTTYDVVIVVTNIPEQEIKHERDIKSSHCSSAGGHSIRAAGGGGGGKGRAAGLSLLSNKIFGENRSGVRDEIRSGKVVLRFII